MTVKELIEKLSVLNQDLPLGRHVTGDMNGPPAVLLYSDAQEVRRRAYNFNTMQYEAVTFVELEPGNFWGVG